jgi:hypothetical protein
MKDFSIISLFGEVIVEFIREIDENKEELFKQIVLSFLIVICFFGALFFGFLWYIDAL